MALIKKQVFLRSRDENLQQFLAKGDKGYMSLDEQANLSDEDHAEINEQLKNLRGKKPSREYDMETMEGQDAYEEDSEAEGFNKPSPKSEPKSPWDDESDAVAQKAFEVDPEGGAKQYDQKERDAKRQRILDHSWKYVKNLEDQGSDNSNSADDRTQKEFIVEGVQDAYFEKSKGNPGPPGSGKRGRAAYKAGRRKETHERAMDVDQPYREKAAKAKGYLGAEGFATGAARRAIKDFDESEGGRKAFRRWHRAGSAVGERARELDRADTAPYKKLTPEEARERQDQDFDDEVMTVKGAIRDAWFGKGDVVPFESGDDKNIRETVEKTRRVTYNYIAANPKMFPDHHKNTDFSKPYDPETDSGLKPAIQQHQMKLKYKQNPEGTMKMQKAVYG